MPKFISKELKAAKARSHMIIYSQQPLITLQERRSTRSTEVQQINTESQAEDADS